MAYTRPFPAVALATTVFVGSVAGGQLLVPTNAARAELRVQPLTDGFRVSPVPSVTASSGLFVAGTQILTVPPHTGGLWAIPIGGATAAIAVWESSDTGP